MPAWLLGWLLGLLAAGPELGGALPAVVQGRRVLVEGATPLHIKGVNWNPIGVGGINPDHLNWRRHVAEDSRLMAEAGINVLRTYSPLTDNDVLDQLWARGIQVINTLYSSAADPLSEVPGFVNAVKDHPAILMWSIGNEWNYNGCYTGLRHHECARKIGEAARIIKRHDSSHPVASVYGNAPSARTVRSVPEVDVWGINYYDDLSFTDLFTTWEATSGRPMFIGEYGADAYNAKIRRPDPGAQAHATAVLTQEIVQNSVLRGGVCLGGIIFELADEWWKDGRGSPHRHDIGGVAPGGGPYPDRTFNEEWWGLMEIDRTPREAYHVFASIPLPREASCGGASMRNVERVCSEDGCRVLATNMRGRNCAQFCADAGLNCAGAWEEIDETCHPQQTLRCDQRFGTTSDLLCLCAPRNWASASALGVASVEEVPAQADVGVRLHCTRGGCTSVPWNGTAGSVS